MSQNILEDIQRFLKAAGADVLEGGPTTHASKDVKKDSMPATEGEQSKTNEADVKKQVGPAAVKQSMNPLEASPEDGGALQIGTTKLPTGKDPANETAGSKDVVPDKTSHPASTENREIGNAKYAEAFTADMSLEKLAAALIENGNRLAAVLLVEKTAGEATETKTAAIDPAAAAKAGSDLAGAVNGTLTEKAAQEIQQDVYAVVKMASDKADLFAQYVKGVAAGIQEKEATVAATAQTMPAAPASHAAAPMKKAQPAVKLAMGPESGDGGDMPAQAPAVESADGMTKLISVLEAMGISPDELAEALQQGGQGGGGAAQGGPPASPGASSMETSAAANKPTPAKLPATNKTAETLREILARGLKA